MFRQMFEHLFTAVAFSGVGCFQLALLPYLECGFGARAERTLFQTADSRAKIVSASFGVIAVCLPDNFTGGIQQKEM